MSNSRREENPGLANSSSWNDSGFAFAPNTNVMDANSMPSSTAAAARAKSDQIMAALRAGDTDKANALMGKDTTPGRLLPGMGWVKRKLNKQPVGKLNGEEVPDQGGVDGASLQQGGAGAEMGKKGKV